LNVVKLSVAHAGIQCTNKIAEIYEAIASSECSLVAQKYIGEFRHVCSGHKSVKRV